MSPITSSTTERVLEYGALNTAMPCLPACVEIHLIGADAEAADGGQRRTRVDDACGHVGLGAYAQQVTPSKRIDEFVLAQGSLQALDFETAIAQRLRRIGVNVFQ